MTQASERDQALLKAVFAKMDPVALAAGIGAVAALGLFCATALLVIKGAPADQPVGPHLALLSMYLPGYSVSWLGSLAGILYGALIGAGIGFVLAVLWNMTHHFYLVAVTIRRHSFID